MLRARKHCHGNIVAQTIFCVGAPKNVSELSQKSFVTATNVSCAASSCRETLLREDFSQSSVNVSLFTGAFRETSA